MSGLPPTFPTTTKVKIRNKTASFKRPFSCEGNGIAKKESKGLFFNLKKGSSNSKLNEDIDTNEYIDHSNSINEEKIIGRIQGRNFDSDDEDYEIPCEETSVTKMDKLFEDYHKVVNNPALLGYLLKYLLSHNIDYNSLLFYLVVQHYKATVQLKEFAKEAQRFANEILTTFVLEKSNLKIDHKVDTLAILDDLKASKDLINIFNKSSDEIFNHCVKSNIDRLRTSIKHGLFTLEISVGTFNFDCKMNFFNECIKDIIKNLENKIPSQSNNIGTKEIKEKVQYLSDIITGVKTSLASIFYFFVKKEKEDNGDNVSLMSNRHLRGSFLGRSTESLQIMTNCVLDKHPIFCSKAHKKPTTHSFFKKGKSLKGHNFQEKTFDYPMECLFCEKLLWGINPQGLYCSHCQEAVHRNCKDFLRINCIKETKRFQRNSSNVTQPTEEEMKINTEEDNISIQSQISNTNTNGKDTQDIKDVIEHDINVYDPDQIIEKQMTSSISSEVSQNIKPGYVISTATIFVTNNDEKINQDAESIDSVSEISYDRRYDHSKSDIDFKNDNHYEDRKYLSPRYIPPGHVKNMTLKYDQKHIPRSQSLHKAIGFKFGDENIENKTLPRNAKRGSESVFVQDLVNDSSIWASDPDMMVEETFDANKELESFPNHVSKEKDKAEYTRLLVLMEFHHKIKFTVMTLKRFEYLLINDWPNNETLLFKTLSLNNINPLYELIKTLNATIEKSKNDTSYSTDIAQNVINWFVVNDQYNLEEWLKYSIDLCCTNSLNLVKNSWKEYYRTDARFSKVLNKRHNKIIMVEQLANMRPLLFNMPLIVSKIFKDLNKFSKFKEESKIWKEIHEKFKKLPTFIDEHCMPLVQLINNGTIVNSLDRSSWFARLNSNDPCFDYILDFPKTAFHPKLFDFQEIKISNFRESGNKNKTPAIFIKDVSDAYAICYDNMLVLLQKENEKYHLKQFKATDTSKMNPILMLENVHASKGESKGESKVFYELTLVFINVAVLTQVLFTKKEVWARWHDFIYQMKSRTLKNKMEVETFENIVDKYLEIKMKFRDFSAAHANFFKEEIKLEINDKLFQIPNDSNEFLVGTSFDAVNILKSCYENLSIPINDNVLDNLLTLVSNMKKRIYNYKNSQSKDVLTTDDILRENSEIQRDELLDMSLHITPSESPNNNESGEDSENDYAFQSSTLPQNDDITHIVEDDILTDIFEMTYEEDLLSFVDHYVDKIIEDAQLYLLEMEPNLNDEAISLLQESSIIFDTPS